MNQNPPFSTNLSIWKITLIISLLQISKAQNSSLRDFTGKIVGGKLASITDFPHSAFLVIKCVQDDTTTFLCGSSIISQDVLMTAAHCVEGCNPSRSWVIAYVGNVEKRAGTAHHSVAFKLHPNYETTQVINDIALILLKNRLKFNDNVKKVIVLRNPAYKEKAETAGWGFVDDAGTQITSYLKYAVQKVMSLKSCQKIFGIIQKGQICVGPDPNAIIGYPNVGDSGSALVVRKNIQIGLVSFKRPSISNSMIVYTDVGYYYDWIKKTACQLLCDYNRCAYASC